MAPASALRYAPRSDEYFRFVFKHLQCDRPRQPEVS